MKRSGKMRCTILEKQTLEAYQLLVFRGELMKADISQKITEMSAYAKSCGEEATGNVISVTFSSRDSEKGRVSEVGIYLPVSGRLENRGDVVWKEKFFLSNAVKLEFEGPPEQLPEACRRMGEYIREKNLSPVTDGYHVMKKVNKQFNWMAVDIYIGVSENVL